MRGGLAGIGVALAVLIGAPRALAATPCPSSFATQINSAAPGSTVTAPAGTCTDNITVTNTNQFTIRAAAGGTTLEPTSASTPIIQSSANVRFTISGIQFTGMNGASAIDLAGSGEAVTLSRNIFTNNTSGNTGAAVNIHTGTSTTTQPTVLEGNAFGAVGAGNTSTRAGGAVSYLGSAPFSVVDNDFVGNSSPSGADQPGGALTILTFTNSSSSPVTVTGNVFGGTAPGAGNTTGTNGGAAHIELARGQPLTLDDNQFIDNAVTGNGVAFGPRLGGALVVTIQLFSGESFPVSQAHNLFEGNVVNETEASGQHNVPAGGGAEWLFGVTDHSTDDVFTGNRVTVNDGAPPEGGGLGVLGESVQGSTPAQPGVFVGANDLFSGNTVAAGGWGGAIYSGFSEAYCTSGCPGTSITVDDSTVTGNSVAAGPGSEGGALWGSPTDTLGVANSIINGNSPSPEVFGFGTRSFSYSDICGFSGTGDICASPNLNANGSETPASPTIDRGSNALVPSGLTTDLVGNPRIGANRVSCKGPIPIVDMGAYEATFKTTPSCNAKVQIKSTKLRVKHGKVKVKLRCPAGYLYCQGTVKLGKRLGSAHFRIADGKTATVTIKLRKKALEKLGNAKTVKLTITVSDHDGQKHKSKSHRKVKLKLR